MLIRASAAKFIGRRCNARGAACTEPRPQASPLPRIALRRAIRRRCRPRRQTPSPRVQRWSSV